MNKKVNFREIKVYQSDDGRKIQHFTNVGNIETSTGPSDNLPFDSDDIADKFIGLNMVTHPVVGNRYISFSIEGAENIYEAFDMYDKFYVEAFNKDADDVNKMLQEYIDNNPDSVNKLSKEQLNSIYKDGQDNNKIIQE